jgi:hypothetical protein
MRRVLYILPIFAVLALSACDYAAAPPANDPTLGVVRQSPGPVPQS